MREMNIYKIYNEWVGTLDNDENVENPFTTTSEWKGHMVKAFVKFCFKKTSKIN